MISSSVSGDELIVIGVLVEEHVVRELARAGYVAPLSGLPADGTDPVESSGALSLLNVPRKSPHENDDDGEDDEHDDEDEHDNDYDDDDESEGPV